MCPSLNHLVLGQGDVFFLPARPGHHLSSGAREQDPPHLGHMFWAGFLRKGKGFSKGRGAGKANVCPHAGQIGNMYPKSLKYTYLRAQQLQFGDFIIKKGPEKYFHSCCTYGDGVGSREGGREDKPSCWRIREQVAICE